MGTCKGISLKREVGYKNVSLFGKLSRFSWNYGGLCSNFAPNSLSIEGRYGYAVPYQTKEDTTRVQSMQESRKLGWRSEYDGPCINLYHTWPAQTSASFVWQVVMIQEAAIMMWWWFEWKGGVTVSALILYVCCIYLDTCILICRILSVSIITSHFSPSL